MSIQLIPYKPAGTIGSGPYVLREYKPDTGIDVSALSIAYTGAYTDYGMVTMSDGARYRLLAFTSSGTLSIEQPVNCEVCVVGGGSKGRAGSSSGGGAGGAGAYLKNQSVFAYNGGSVVVGAERGVSSIADVSVNKVGGYASSPDGGTGGGGGYDGNGGTGDGISKYPFGDVTYTLWASKPHCAGGGQGATDNNGYGYKGGNGGTNGGNGYPQGSSQVSNPSGGEGGSYGGGAGGINSSGHYDGRKATYYGSGGGGGVRDANGNGLGGSGYQGIVYMRIPVIQ